MPPASWPTSTVAAVRSARVDDLNGSRLRAYSLHRREGAPKASRSSREMITPPPATFRFVGNNAISLPVASSTFVSSRPRLLCRPEAFHLLLRQGYRQPAPTRNR